MSATRDSRDHYVSWREDFDDQYGWMTAKEVRSLSMRLKKLGWNPKKRQEGEGEAEIKRVIRGSDVTDAFVK